MVLKLTLALAMFFFSQPDRIFADEMVNPHWTGTHCLECHTDEQGGARRYGDDSIELCNRCHDGNSAPPDPHPVGVTVPQAIRRVMPASWPLHNDRITCLTCHDALVQMHDSPLVQLLNPSFLRSRSAASPGNFCFGCHDAQNYRKENPHEQLDATGTVIEKSCLSCHRSVPDTNAAIEAAMDSLRGEPTRLCVSCHGSKDVNHPVWGNHLLPVPDTMGEALRVKSAGHGVSLPLVNNSIACVTCHNPHQRGVLKKPESASGAGEADFLRLKAGAALCTHCHDDMQMPDAPGTRRQSTPVAPPRPEATIQHKPCSEEKCKACHAISGYEENRREELFLCFRDGCHETKVIKNAVVHERSVLGSCSFCHNPHSSGYNKLLFTDEDTLCATCHPLLRGKDGAGFKESKHEFFLSYTANRLTLPSGYECHFCHSPDHGKDLQAVNTELCGTCHLYLRKAISLHDHKQYADQACSGCHDPHASPYQYLLKQPPETYRR